MKRYEIFVFRTSLNDANDIASISPILNICDNIKSWSVDLDDWERVLRVVCCGVTSNDISNIIKSKGFYCSELEYLPNEIQSFNHLSL